MIPTLTQRFCSAFRGFENDTENGAEVLQNLAFKFPFHNVGAEAKGALSLLFICVAQNRSETMLRYVFDEARYHLSKLQRVLLTSLQEKITAPEINDAEGANEDLAEAFARRFDDEMDGLRTATLLLPASGADTFEEVVRLMRRYAREVRFKPGFENLVRAPEPFEPEMQEKLSEKLRQHHAELAVA